MNSLSLSPSKDSQELVDKLKTELSRLKKHLIQIEEDYTSELVEVQQREQTLDKQLIEARAEIEQLNRRLNNTGPLVAIRQQAEQALDERDQVLQRCSKLEDEVQRSQASLANLQLVIERMQKGNFIIIKLLFSNSRLCVQFESVTLYQFNNFSMQLLYQQVN